MGNLDQAIKLYEQAVALDPLRANSHLGRAYLLYVAGRYDEARAPLQKALDLNPHAALVSSHSVQNSHGGGKAAAGASRD
jgi:tetratricopeptide (TPR) repeat protein